MVAADAESSKGGARVNDLFLSPHARLARIKDALASSRDRPAAAVQKLLAVAVLAMDADTVRAVADAALAAVEARIEETPDED